MKNRKGTHVGMILSFMIFVGFLVFVYIVIEPAINRQQNKDNFLEYLKNEISLEATEVLISVVIANETDPETSKCLEINQTDFINKTLINLSELSVIVKDGDGNLVPAIILNENHTLIYWGGNETFLKVFYSEAALDESAYWGGICSPLELNYHLGLAQANKRIFSTKLIDLINEYHLDYEILKVKLKVPSTHEFDFIFTLDNGTLLEATGQNVSQNVYAGEYPVQYVDEEANIKFGKLNIRVW